MKRITIETPMSIQDSLGSRKDEAKATLAAFMLLVGAKLRQQTEWRELASDDELFELGLLEWWQRSTAEIAPQHLDETQGVTYAEAIAREDYYGRLGDMVDVALKHSQVADMLRVVAEGLRCPDDLVRVCALTSALELFKISLARLFQRLAWFVHRPLHPTTEELVSMILAKALGRIGSRSLLAGGAGAKPVSVEKGLVLIHGTNFHWDRPEWSVPGSGGLFNQIKTVRPDVYGASDYFRWEGGYSDYAREVAALNLQDWLLRRSFNGIDAVTHSHGGNVLIESTSLGMTYGKVIFLSCPVHWSKYSPAKASIKHPSSVRIRFDLVILADRGRQRFPTSSGIPETILPRWFVWHGDTYDPAVWTKHKLDKLL